MSFEKIYEAAQALPESVKDNALDLLDRMSSTLEGIGDEGVEWRPLNLRLIQSTSDRSKLPKGAGIGSFVLGEQLLEQPVEIIPLRLWDSRQMWSPDQNEARTLCYSLDAKIGANGTSCYACPHAVFNEEERKMDCTKSKTFLCITADLREIFTVNFSKTNYSFGRDWEGLLKKAGVATFKRTYNIKSETGAKAKNVEAMRVDPAGSTAEELHPFLKALFDKSTEDRKEILVKFKASAEARRGQANNLLAGPAAGEDDGTILIEATPASTQETAESASSNYKL